MEQAFAVTHIVGMQVGDIFVNSLFVTFIPPDIIRVIVIGSRDGGDAENLIDKSIKIGSLEAVDKEAKRIDVKELIRKLEVDD